MEADGEKKLVRKKLERFLDWANDAEQHNNRKTESLQSEQCLQCSVRSSFDFLSL